MEKVRHLAKVMQPTDWVNSMVVSSRGENIRNCLDPADLNKAFKHEHYPKLGMARNKTTSPTQYPIVLGHT